MESRNSSPHALISPYIQADKNDTAKRKRRKGKGENGESNEVLFLFELEIRN